MSLTPESKSKLSTTIRTLRAGLLRDLEDHVMGVYRLAAPIGQAGLAEADTVRRGRLEAWLDERTRGAGGKDARSRFLKQAVKEAAATLVNRLVFLRLLEQTRGPDNRPLRRTQIVSGGWSSKGYLEFRDYAGVLLDDESEGYGTLLELVFDDLAVDLPGLYGSVGVTDLIPVPTASLRLVIEALNHRDLDGAWDDDTTLGWVYQYWNDPEREALDDKIKGGGKIEPHEIAAKTQMFTERYMVEWLLHNSLGPTWLALCRRQGWRADVEDVLPDLEARRAEWRAKREAGEVALDALMPILSPLEERWKYYVLQDIPAEAVAAAPDSLRDLKLLDPACGSGHFPVIACGLLFELYREEARHRGEDGTEAWSDRAIVAHILEDNLHGIDIDPRAVQIAAAALWLKARTLASGVRLRRLNLVAPAFNLSGLPDDDPALKTLLHEVWRDTGLPENLTRGIVRVLAGADHLGTLLKVDEAVADAVLSHQIASGVFEREPVLFKHWGYQVETANAASDPTADENEPQRNTEGHRYLRSSVAICGQTKNNAKGALILDKLEGFLARHTARADLGLHLDGEQMAMGVRFIRMVQEKTYHIVVGNPPYQGVGKLRYGGYYKDNYNIAKTDVFAVFMMRGLQLCARQGIMALVTLQNWMFSRTYTKLRIFLLRRSSITVLADLHKGAFTSVKLIPAVLSCFRNGKERRSYSIFIRQLPLHTIVRDDKQAYRNQSALSYPHQTYNIRTLSFSAVPTIPLIYWWSHHDYSFYKAYRKIGVSSPGKFGLTTSNNDRFVRRWFETAANIYKSGSPWAPYILGAKGKAWFEELSYYLNWRSFGLEIGVLSDSSSGAAIRNKNVYFNTGIAFSMIGVKFTARMHRYPSIIGNMGSSLYPDNPKQVLCSLNSRRARDILSSLNPGHHFEVGDVNRLPVFSIEGADAIYTRLDAAFTEHEAARENSVEFRRPGPSAWRTAQDWAQRAVDRPAGEPLPKWVPDTDLPAAVTFVSFALGVALGRFAADGGGIVDEAPPTALPHGLLFLSAGSRTDSLDHSACAGLRAAWAEHGGAVKRGAELRDWLRLEFFKHHRTLYENRPIWLPLSSAKRNFVVFAAIHRWHDGTLDEVRVLLKDERKRRDGELEDVKHARATGDAKTRGAEEKRQEDLRALLAELDGFAAKVEAVSEQGAPPAPGGKPRNADARFVMDLDDGVMVNAAALWPLLDPHWKGPVKWWKELCDPKGRKDYDWSHLAARYFPSRVDGKCQTDSSLAVAHRCFWRYHPARAYAWEVRLQDEIGPDFRINEVDSDDARTRFLAEQPDLAREIEEKEFRRRDRKRAKGSEDEAEVVDEEDAALV